MSAIRSALQELAGEPDDYFSVDELGADVREFGSCPSTIRRVIGPQVKSIADRHGHQVLGYSSPTNLLVDQGRMSPGEAKQVVAQGNAREKAPYAYAAWVDGRLSTSQARHLFATAEAPRS